MHKQCAKRLVFTGKQQVAIEDFSVPPPAEDEVLVRTQFSLMSTGTENIVFNRIFDPGTHWDEWVKYPFYPGYAAVGEVIAVGSAIGNLAVGDKITHRKGHCSYATLKATECVQIPADVPLDEAVWFALAKIAFHGALAAQYQLGDTVLIIGAGPIGQMAVRWARAAGAVSILVADIAEVRLQLALSGGATAVISGAIENARNAILLANEGILPRVVIDSTGNAGVFANALGLAANFGRVVVLGDTGQPANQRLTKDVITRGLSIIGAHDNHNTAEWNLQTITQLFLSLVSQKRFSLSGINTHTFAPEACKDAYEIANRDRTKTMGIVFDWR